MNKCVWCKDGGLLEKYHDEEWGKPIEDDQKLFEYLSLEVLQCGLNWMIVLKKREIFNLCFDDFNFQKISKYQDMDINRILNTSGMIKSKRKILAIINNAILFMNIIKEFGSFSNYLWKFTNNHVFIYMSHQNMVVSKNNLSDKISNDLKKRGFKFIGSTTIYSYLQSCGLINDHNNNCFCYEKYKKVKQYICFDNEI